MRHADLCKLALVCLKRPYSRGGHGCKVALDECRTGWSGEIPDALGFATQDSTCAMARCWSSARCRVPTSWQSWPSPTGTAAA